MPGWKQPGVSCAGMWDDAGGPGWGREGRRTVWVGRDLCRSSAGTSST